MSKRLTGLNPLAYIGVEPTEPANTYMSPLAPTPTDVKNFNLGDFWVDTETEILYCLVSQQRGVAVWIPLSGGGSGGAVNFITPNGTAVESGGNINIQGDGTTITTSGSGDTLVFSATGNFPAPITVPNGGTGNSSFVPYAVVAGGTTSTGPLQQVSGLGTSGFVLTSGGPGTLPTWQASSGTASNGLFFIQKQTVSGATEVDFTTGIDSTFNNYVLIFDSVTAVSTGSFFYLVAQLSTNGGSSYINTGYFGQGPAVGLVLSQFLTSNSGGTEVTSGSANLLDLTIDLAARYPASATVFMIWDGAATSTSGVGLTSIYPIASIPVNALRIVLSNGAAFSGSFSLYGISQASGSNPPGTFHTNGNDATTAANAITIVGTGGITTSGSGSTVTINGGNVPLTATVTLTSTQIKNLVTTPILVIAAPGAGKIINVLSVASSFHYGGSNPFSNAGAGATNLYYVDNTSINNFSQTAVSGSNITSTSSFYSFGNAQSITQALTSSVAVNTSIVIAQPSSVSNYGGNAANDNSILVEVTYEIISTF